MPVPLGPRLLDQGHAQGAFRRHALLAQLFCIGRALRRARALLPRCQGQAQQVDRGRHRRARARAGC